MRILRPEADGANRQAKAEHPTWISMKQVSIRPRWHGETGRQSYWPAVIDRGFGESGP
jgi:hypothetical protein